MNNTPQKQKKSAILLLFAAVIVYKSYDIINGTFFTLIPMLFRQYNPIDPYLIDSIANTTLLILYSYLFIKYYKPATQNLAQPVLIPTLRTSKDVVKYLVITLGLGGISSMWLLSVDSLLYKIDFIGKSYRYMMEATSGMDDSAFIFVFISAVIVSPIVEELLFRGLLYTIFTKITSHTWIAIIVPSLLFGIWHNIFVQAVYASILGIMLTFIYHKTKDIRLCMLIHIINNFINTVFTTPLFEDFYFYLSMFQLLLAIPSIYLVFKLVKDKHQLDISYN